MQDEGDAVRHEALQARRLREALALHPDQLGVHPYDTLEQVGGERGHVILGVDPVGALDDEVALRLLLP